MTRRHGPPPSVWRRRRPLLIAIAAVALAAVSMVAMAVAPAPLVDTRDVSPFGARPAASEPTRSPSIGATGRAERTPAPIFTESAPDEPQPWSPDDGPLHPRPVPSPRPSADVEDRPAPPVVGEGPPAPSSPAGRPSDPGSVGPGDEAGPPPPSPDPQIDPHPIAALGLPELVNRERLAAGCGPIAIDPNLEAHAEQHAVAQAEQDRMHHSDGPAGVDAWGENVAAGQQTALEAHDDWMGSLEHRAIVLDCAFTVIGVAAADSPAGVRYWVEVFAA